MKTGGKVDTLVPEHRVNVLALHRSMHAHYYSPCNTRMYGMCACYWSGHARQCYLHSNMAGKWQLMTAQSSISIDRSLLAKSTSCITRECHEKPIEHKTV